MIRKEVTIGHCRLILGDCMDVMREMGDKEYSLAITDPPYGLNIAKEKPRVSGRWNYIPKHWDSNIPDDLYFYRLKEVSDNQIIWGGNYYSCLGATRGYVIWDKLQPVENFADSEFAWTSFDRVSKTFRYSVTNNNFGSDKKIHVTQKPVALYAFLLNHYARPGDTILDTHLGSGSSAIACNKLGFKFTGIEIDEDYFNAACERIASEYSQTSLFDAPMPNPVFEQTALL